MVDCLIRIRYTEHIKTRQTLSIKHGVKMKNEFEISFLKDNEIKGTTITASSEQNAVIKFRRDYGDFDIVEIEEKQKIIIKPPLTCGVFILAKIKPHMADQNAQR